MKRTTKKEINKKEVENQLKKDSNKMSIMCMCGHRLKKRERNNCLSFKSVILFEKKRMIEKTSLCD